MRLSVRWQLVLVLVTLSLLPMTVSGVAAYRSARGALDQSIRFNLESLATQTEERLERMILDRQAGLNGWSQLRLIQDDTVTADADGRILQFLQDAKRNFELQELWVASAAGQVIASTSPGMRGREVGDKEWLQAARRGERWAGAPEMQEFTNRVGLPLAVPLRASFDQSKIVGVLVEVIDWPKIVETLQTVKVVPEGQTDRGYLLLADSRGTVLSAPPFFSGWEAGKTHLSTLGLDAVKRSRVDRGSTVSVTTPSCWVCVERAAPLPSRAWRCSWTDVARAARQPDGHRAAVERWPSVAAAAVYGQPFRGRSSRWSRFWFVAAGDPSGVLPSSATMGPACSRRTICPRSCAADPGAQQAGFQITSRRRRCWHGRSCGGLRQQAASIAQVTATMEELTNTAKQIAQSATSVEKIADDSAHAAHAGYASVGEALEAMENIRRRVADISGKTLLLGERSRRISEVLNLIKEIAGEIHLLAVNAAIESAAAGEHGKRFAVVASEVRRLAERTRDSAEEIKAIVGEIQSATQSSVLATEQGVKEVESGVALATGARGSLEQIIQMVDRTTQAIRQITFATQQQRSASEQIVQTMREVAVVTSESAAGMKQSAASVGELNVLADQFKTRIKEFKL